MHRFIFISLIWIIIAGIFTLNDTFIAQFCDSHGNQRWMKYDNETQKWSGVGFVTHGCRG